MKTPLVPNGLAVLGGLLAVCVAGCSRTGTTPPAPNTPQAARPVPQGVSRSGALTQGAAAREALRCLEALRDSGADDAAVPAPLPHGSATFRA